jgi:hypothetical protein
MVSQFRDVVLAVLDRHVPASMKLAAEPAIHY